ncbi:hypothetical protein [Chryseobacterium indologenes]|uniref:Uncharacterized protein n=1 Tax=Chryseobacterium indologenes TaxID=253 RepID=A0A0N0ZS48_CHRID|nr:hypothetical protein [Chryseobacterium indologenes]KPE49030.1 hypothetical protein AOB46_22270 [Chryseobacterium indologenes]
MKENLKKIKDLFLILIILLLNNNCTSKLTAQNIDNKDLYDYFDKWTSSKDKFKYLEIDLDIDCNNKLLFAVSKKDYIFNYNVQYRAYMYNDVLVIYIYDDNIVNENNKLFFDRYLKKINFDIKTLEQGNQSLINSYSLYFENNRLINDSDKINTFIMNNCKK